jgi:outer membrane lipoprotein-sorting protein
MKRYTNITVLILFISQALAQPASRTATITAIKSEQGINDPRANGILQKMRKNIMDCKSLQVSFSQDGKQEGTLLMSGNKYALTLPDEQVITNGTTLWMYMRKSNEVNIYSYIAEKDELNPFLVIKNYEKNYRAKYIREESVNGRKCDIIDLQPLDGKGIIYKFRLYVNKENFTPLRFEAYSKGESTSSYIITTWKPNVSVQLSSFEFNPKSYPNILENDMR